MGKKKRRPRRQFTPEFKAEIVELCRRGDRTVHQVVKDFDLTYSAVAHWIEQAYPDPDAPTGPTREALTLAEKTELTALRQENARLKQDVEILKRATAFFAKETR
ncbi:transposase [Actinocrispum wychmicini]|uniref:transposase n=1 Tax=Actinocrispum wychmicini TaxID=1213861 RepID=UPI001A9D5D4C|nr:transposase [Actinocrispum wychmicini]